ncbi:glycosyltransferase family 2 protein [Bacteroides fragilis]|uniref:Glycosyl transferase 2 family protein n=2 Tax=Bacteroides fragilis TaxID=817 RepID=A0A015Y5J9_BACFG|nr:glycosyltransferase family 2 protein [Bacteroides fragilis]EXY18957.1 glycosyl transferase 2 family protein [Bacteroides fragilis str. 2-F-2 \
MKVSILIPVYNGNSVMDECIKSVLNQTFQDFEILLINDGSTDNSLELLLKYQEKDDRIRVINSEHNFINTLNQGLELSQGEYIARMDIDDIMDKERLFKQVNLLDENPNIAVCGSWIESFGLVRNTQKGLSGLIQYPMIYLLTGNFISHPSVMMRKCFLENHDIKYKLYPHAEDYKLWTDIARCRGEFWIIPECLVKYRISPLQVSYVYSEEQRVTSCKIQNEVLDFLIQSNYFPNNDKMNIILSLLCEYNAAGYVSDDTIVDMCFEILHNYYNLGTINRFIS